MANIELPLAEVTGYLIDMIDTLGTQCTVDGVSTKMMLSDLQRTYNNIQENSKQAVIAKDIAIARGSYIKFVDGREAIVYTIPTDDLISYSMKILMCNASIDIYTYSRVLDENTGDLISEGESVSETILGFVERISAKEKQYDIGILHEAILRLVTQVDVNIKMNDIVAFKGKKYKVIDIDDITEGLLTIQLANVL